MAPPCCGSVQKRLLYLQSGHTASRPPAPQTHTVHLRCGNVCQCSPPPLPRYRLLCQWGLGCHSADSSLPGRSVGTSLRSPPGRRCPSLPTSCPIRWAWAPERMWAMTRKGHRWCCRGFEAMSARGVCSSQTPPSGQSLSPQSAANPGLWCWLFLIPVSEECTNVPYWPEGMKDNGCSYDTLLAGNWSFRHFVNLSQNASQGHFCLNQIQAW